MTDSVDIKCYDTLSVTLGTSAMPELHNDDEAYQGRKIGKMIKAVSPEHLVET